MIKNINEYNSVFVVVLYVQVKLCFSLYCLVSRADCDWDWETIADCRLFTYILKALPCPQQLDADTRLQWLSLTETFMQSGEMGPVGMLTTA